MNEAAANVLYEAERTGVKQIRGTLRTSDGGRCALAVLRDAMETSSLMTWHELACPLCGGGRYMAEAYLIVHLNDDHHLTFSEIARKLGPDSV